MFSLPLMAVEGIFWLTLSKVTNRHFRIEWSTQIGSKQQVTWKCSRNIDELAKFRIPTQYLVLFFIFTNKVLSYIYQIKIHILQKPNDWLLLHNRHWHKNSLRWLHSIREITRTICNLTHQNKFIIHLIKFMYMEIPS